MRILYSAFTALFGLLASWAFVLALRFSVLQGLWASLVLLAGFAIAFALLRRFGKLEALKAAPWWRIFLAAFALNIPLMLFVGHYFLGGSGADYYQMFSIATSYLAGEENPFPYKYGAYPNNHFLLMFMIWLFSSLRSIDPSMGNDALLWCHVVLNIVLIQASFLLVALAARKLWGPTWGGICGLAMILYAPYWTSCSNPYSDTSALFFIALCLLLVAHMLASHTRMRPGALLLLCALFGLSCAIGFELKATVAILLIAFVMCALLAAPLRRALLATLLALAAFVGGVVACDTWVDATRPAELAYGEQERYDMQFPYVHWIAMGLNTENGGAYLRADYDRTRPIVGYDEKAAADSELLRQRYEALGGPAGLARHILFTKTARQWEMGALLSDQIFSYDNALDENEDSAQEGQGAWEGNGTIALLFRLYTIYAQGYHMLLLGLVAAAAFLLARSFYAKDLTVRLLQRSPDDTAIGKMRRGAEEAEGAGRQAACAKSAQAAYLVFLMVALFGFSLFLCGIWEVKPRYLLHFMPLLIILAVCGMPTVAGGNRRAAVPKAQEDARARGRHAK